MPVPVTAALLRDRFPLPRASSDGDKEDRGRALLIAGSVEVPGAALLSGEAILRAGAGKVIVATPAPLAVPLAVAFPEARVVGLTGRPAPRITRLLAGSGGDGPHVTLIGPGMEPGLARAATKTALKGRVPLILDAAAQHGLWPKVSALRHRPGKAGLVLTPHAGEMANLLGRSKDEILADPVGAATRVAAHFGAVIVLKGATTIVATPQGGTFRHRGAVEGLATAGSGDVLAGLLAGFVAAGADMLSASLWAVLLHAEAGRRLARRVGTVGYLARELAGEIPVLIDRLSGR